MASLKFSTTEPNIASITPAYTSITWSGKFTSNTYVQDTDFNNIKMNDNNDIDHECLIMSASVEDITFSGPYKRSYNIRGNMNTTNSWASPVIDLRKTHAVIIGNIINFDLTDENKPRVGKALAKYLTKPIGLSLAADDLQVYLTAYKPINTDIAVYGKFCHAEDVRPFDDHDWIRLETSANYFYSSSIDKFNFIDLAYTLPNTVRTGEYGEFEYVNDEGFTFTGFSTFAIKIIELSNDSAIIPRVKNARGIALKV